MDLEEKFYNFRFRMEGGFLFKLTLHDCPDWPDEIENLCLDCRRLTKSLNIRISAPSDCSEKRIRLGLLFCELNCVFLLLAKNLSSWRMQTALRHRREASIKFHNVNIAKRLGRNHQDVLVRETRRNMMSANRRIALSLDISSAHQKLQSATYFFCKWAQCTCSSWILVVFYCFYCANQFNCNWFLLKGLYMKWSVKWMNCSLG